MFTLWYSVLSFKEYINSASNDGACTKSNDARSSSPKPTKPSIPVQIPTKPITAPTSVPVVKPLVKPVTPTKPTPSTTPNRFQQQEQQQENRIRGYQPSPLVTKKPDAAAASAQFIKRENSYSSEDEEEADEDDEDEEDSEIERIDLHHK